MITEVKYACLEGKIVATTTDKASWGEGPWLYEPDLVIWTHADLFCLARRGPVGSWSGYVGIPMDHDFADCDQDETDDLLGEHSPHGGITYYNQLLDPVETLCLIAKNDGQPGTVPELVIGFDCGHAGDISPKMDADLRELRMPRSPSNAHNIRSIYRDVAYVIREIENLANGIAAYARKEGTNKDGTTNCD